MDHAFSDAKIATAQFFAEDVLPQPTAFESAMVSAHSEEGVFALDDVRCGPRRRHPTTSPDPCQNLTLSPTPRTLTCGDGSLLCMEEMQIRWYRAGETW